MGAVRSSPELVALGRDGKGQDRFTSREMIAAEVRLERATESLAQDRGHEVGARHQERALAQAESSQGATPSVAAAASSWRRCGCCGWASFEWEGLMGDLVVPL